MYYQLTRLGLCAVKQKRQPLQFSGSSKFKCNNFHVMPKNIAEQYEEKKEEIKPVKSVKTEEKERKLYGLRKTKIRNKILNFFSLNKSKKFCAFYSISFPIGISDEIGYKLLNTWLTRCRKELGLRSYLWVAERQKNGTLHFHLITHNYMPIRKANDFMKAALYTQWEKGLINCKEEIILNYNGCDVDNLYQSKKNRHNGKRLNKIQSQRKLSMYLTKYISKNDTKSERLPWHCSRDISALFISINYQDVSSLEIAQLVADNPEAVTIYDKEYFTMYYFKFIPDDFHFVDLQELNEIAFRLCQKN